MSTGAEIVPVHDVGAAMEAIDALDAMDNSNAFSNPRKTLSSASSVRSQPEGYDIVPWALDPFQPEVTEEDEANLDGGWLRKAHDELQEKSQWRDRDIQALRDIVQNERGLLCPTDDAFLLKFLRAQKFNYEKSFAMLRRYFNMRRSCPQNFTKSLPSLARPIFLHQQQTVLPHRDQLGRRIFLFRAGSWNPSKVSPSDIFAANYLLLELIAREPKTQIAGLVMVVDMSGFSFSQIMHVTTDYVRSIANIIQNTFPLRFRQIHIINESYLFDIVFQLIKPFLSDVIRSRIVFHGSNLEKLHSAIDPSVLPQEFGGHLGPLDNSRVVGVMEKSEDFYRDLTRYGFTDTTLEEAVEPAKHPFQSYCLSGPLPEDD